MAFVVGTFFHFWILTVLADLGDKTFFIVATFSAWCPVCGIREHSAGLLALEYFLVFVGSSIALVMRTVLLSFGVNPFAWDGFCEVAATIILFLLAIKATYDWRQSLADEWEAGEAGSGIANGREKLSVKDDPEASGYGSASSGVWQRPEEGWAKVLLTALVLPGAAALFAEAGDRSQGVLMNTEHRRADLALGASLGFVASIATAVLCGFCVRRAVSPKWLLFFATSLLWLICISCLRDALMRLVLGVVPLTS
mmetsp:Transcript_45632/g.130224  ORF Transcript_45632/g.130224 Transcript_45632/m.130224 type:complete len:254 (-) Transcript_45632:37-798(-)